MGQAGTADLPVRIDLYFDPTEYHFKVSAAVWRRFVVVGAGESLYLVDQSNHQTLRPILTGYFCEFVISNDQLLVASAEKVLAIGPAGRELWLSDALGIDGIVIHEVTTEAIKGAGEWGPPDGWREFSISLQSGLRTP